jgi:ATP-dependent helicase/nuclease subunit A
VTAEVNIEHIIAAQARATSPEASVWVSANAGAGKTYVLVRRVLRLLLGGTAPEKILCLTYTRTAAAEMADRLLHELSRWATMPAPELVKAFSEIEGQEPDKDDIITARTLFARTLEAPGSLRIQTIHAFCESLMRRFPLEAGIQPNSSLMDGESAREMRQDALNAVILRAARQQESALGKAMQTIISLSSEKSFPELINKAINNKHLLLQMSKLGGTSANPFQAASQILHQQMEVTDAENAEELREELGKVVSKAELRDASLAFADGSKKDGELAKFLAQAANARNSHNRIEALRKAFMTQANQPRADSFITKATREAYPELSRNITAAKSMFAICWQRWRKAILVLASEALWQLANAVLQEYENAKASQAVMDFDDLIDHTISLLSNPVAAPWVMYKLDGGIEHIMVDEAQDTSERQWELIYRLAGEFFAGTGPIDKARTIFAVGDEKQSIYSFQGAEPALFATMGEQLQASISNSGQSLLRIPLSLSFRSSPAILQAVDAVFANIDAVPGIAFDAKAPKHSAYRTGQAGLVEVWPVEKVEKAGKEKVWDPTADIGSIKDPVHMLAARIADKIKYWLENKIELPSRGRPIRPSDIMILVRRRRPFASVMISALNARGIPVAGADRMRITDNIAVKDMLSLGNFLLLPQDDLSLAAVLKSPLFDVDDDDLFKIAYGRKASLWKSLQAADDYSEQVALLKRWMQRADKVPPYELFSGILEQDNMRVKLVARLGLEANDALDELLGMAITYDDVHTASLQGFIDYLRQGTTEIKRDMEKGNNEVRLMTVHGAKGMEASIVFLPDTCKNSSAGGRGNEVLELPGNWPGSHGLMVWEITGSGRDIEAIRMLKEGIKQREVEEYNRLLYVAMTRACDQLYICGWEGTTARSKSCWYNLVWNGLEGLLQEEDAGEGRVVWRLVSEQTAAPIYDVDEPQITVGETDYPAWLDSKAVAPSPPAISISPSEMKVATSSDFDPVSCDRYDTEVLPNLPDYRKLRGSLSHALLEHLPGIPKDERVRAADGFIQAKANELELKLRSEIISEVIKVLDNEELKYLFATNSASEVPIIADVPAIDGDNVRITGRIDRLIVSGKNIRIIDYKTDRNPPATIPDQYLAQLAAYHMALSRMHPEYSIECGILWTSTASVVWMDSGEILRGKELFIKHAKAVQ